ncbi:MAG: metal-sensitive transcriptional regulator [Gammaproteobacteria bacterium]|nr:metal-sensitive transcriptional regulator [Gammaproteobacteria bacterium]MBU6509199.1 metal-sensitive transcriptional regulator [Gammaproteobacteria bacterium]MDE1984091.1 metal-sensitive transcriptional regulator [Gammaproteobacteria bacterium]MDE2108612.1 metal-sensitive transcriptional regulator [Gammaproteobacteria bacterium]MDE2461654.1 metal-sensitive transcriptional regulator [Gammaproteobacteria bacterium]
MKHPGHQSQLPRLKRIQGQAAGLVRMVEEERYCADILTQIRAVQAALRSVEQGVLKTHIEHCVAGAIESGDARARQTKLDELYDILKRFGN